MKGVVMATMMEAGPLVEALSMKNSKSTPFRVFRNDGLCLIVSGIGKVNAAVAVSSLVLEEGADAIINIGAAGATGFNLELGDILQIQSVTDADRPHIIGSEMRVDAPDLITGFNNATLVTRDAPAVKLHERNALAAIAELVDMEGAAVLRASRLFSRPCFMFKIVSDTPSHGSEADIIRNIKKVRKALADYFIGRVLNSLPDNFKQIPVNDP